MNQQKGKGTKNLKEVPAKSCLKSKDNPRQSTSGAAPPPPPKYGAHSGIKFNFNLKKGTIVKPFSFDSFPKNEKEPTSPLLEKAVEKQANTDEKDSTDAGGQVKVVMDTLKISRSIESKSKERSPSKEKTPKTPVNDTPKDKKACSRCSRAPKSQTQPAKEVRPEVKPLKIAKSQGQPLKTAKPETQQPLKSVKAETQPPSKMVKSRPQCSKLARLQAAKPQMKTSNASKPESNPNNEVKPEADARNIENPEFDSYILEKSECISFKAETTESCHVYIEKSEFGSTNGEKLEYICAKSETPEFDAFSSENHESDACSGAKPQLLNGKIPKLGHLNKAESEPKLFNGTSCECEPSNGTDLESLPSNGTKNQSGAMKSASKIPRKTHGAHSGMKFHANVKKETVPQPFSFENRCPNMKNQPIDNEENAVIN